MTHTARFLAIGAQLVLVSACSGDPSEGWHLYVGGPVSVAQGILLPDSGWMTVSVAAEGVDLEEASCQPPSSDIMTSIDFYNSASSTVTGEYRTDAYSLRRARLRAVVAFSPGAFHETRRPDRWVAGTVYGTSEVVEAAPCASSAGGSEDRACYHGNFVAPVLVDSAFAGCE